MARVYLSLGSNIDPTRHLADAMHALGRAFGQLETSPSYRSAAVGFAGPAFVNLVAAFDCGLARPDLRDWLRRLEDASGRDRSLPRYANRTLDLDIALWCTGNSCATDLTQAEFERAHVLAPLADIAPGLQEPFTNTSVRERWRALAPGLPAVERLPP